jgi:hypothetical protein
MSNSFGKPLMYLRDRWRWVRGRCPLCNRNLYAAFHYYMADQLNQNKSVRQANQPDQPLPSGSKA